MTLARSRDSENPARFRAAVIGGTGYGGAELIRLLVTHPAVELARVTSIDHVDEPLEAVHRTLGPTGLTFEKMSATEAAQGVDVVFLALPHKVSATMAATIDHTSGISTTVCTGSTLSRAQPAVSASNEVSSSDILRGRGRGR